ncbi:hypothetical protein DY000_02040842 [Brassica cretica]|uniref:Uncharacterized protein n=1 Tax=Brassica cretica TaxID=69181 RepID=A0ABQ7BIJ1_BRACR|nr:hypothetical protein DY000_02040842 [Brassica cretica]
MGSDHKPILVCLFGNQHGARGAFKFDKRMIGKQEVREYIHEAWNYHSGSGQRSLVQRFGSVHMNLGSWKRETCNNSRERMNVLRTYLVAEYSTGDLNWEKINFLKSEIAQAFCHEEEFWGQMSRDKWLVVGDNNTSFFYASVKDSRRRNQLSKLTDDAGREATSTDSMGQVEVEYFETLFTSGTGENLSEVCSDFTTKVTEEMNEALIREIVKDSKIGSLDWIRFDMDSDGELDGLKGRTKVAEEPPIFLTLVDASELAVFKAERIITWAGRSASATGRSDRTSCVPTWPKSSESLRILALEKYPKGKSMIGSNKEERSSVQSPVHALVELAGKDELQFGQFDHLVVDLAEVPIRTFAG